MLFKSDAVLESSLYPGVRVTTKKFSVARRSAMELEIAEFRARIHDAYRELADCTIVPDEKDELGNMTQRGDSPAVVEQKTRRLRGVYQTIESLTNQSLKPAMLRTYIAKVEGLDIEVGGRVAPATPKSLIDDGPADLCDEVYGFIQQQNGLTVEEQGESSPPIISAAPAGGDSMPTTAASAGSADPSASATAESTTP